MLSSRKKEEEQPKPARESHPPRAAQEQQNPPIPNVVDDSDVVVTYANFCRVAGTPEELIIDFALNSQVFESPSSPINVKNRVVMNFYTAKRLLHTLAITLQRHEAAFGPLEVDVKRRIEIQQQIQQLLKPQQQKS